MRDGVRQLPMAQCWWPHDPHHCCHRYARRHIINVFHVCICQHACTHARTHVRTHAHVRRYDSPAVSSVHPANGPSMGGGTLTVGGYNFVADAAGRSETARIDGTAAGVLAWVSSTSLMIRQGQGFQYSGGSLAGNDGRRQTTVLLVSCPRRVPLLKPKVVPLFGSDSRQPTTVGGPRHKSQPITTPLNTATYSLPHLDMPKQSRRQTCLVVPY